MIKTIREKLQSGLLREILLETKWIYGYTARYKTGILLYILLGLGLTAVGLAASVTSKYLIDAVTTQDGGRLAGLLVFYVAFNLGRIGLNAVSSRLNAKLSVKASNEIRADVFRRFLNIDWQASLDYHSGDLLSRISGDVATVSGSVLGWVPSLVTGVIQFAATLAVILFFDPIMALIALLSAPVTVLLSRVLLKQMRAFGKQVREAQAALTSFYEEALQNLQAVKAFSLNRKFSGRLDELQGLYQAISLDYNAFSVRTHLLLSVVGFVVSCLCMGWGVFRLWNGYISFGTMVLFIQLASLVSSSFSGLVNLVPSAINATVAARRIMTILDLPMEDQEVSAAAKGLADNAPAYGVTVRAEHVRFTYRNGRKVFSDLNLHAAPGEIIGIVSPSGGGKTTLIRMLLGLITPDSGSILFQSGGYTAPFSPCLRQLVTYVAQEKVVFSGTIADCLRLSNANASGVELEEALRLACAWDFVSALPNGVHTQLGERGSGLSEGQIQRLAIARALLSDAPVMLLDEATSALDIRTERKVLENLLSGGAKRTVIVTTHRPTVLLSCTRVYSITGHEAALLSPSEVHTFIQEG